MGYLPLPICPVNGNIVQSHRSLARTRHNAFRTSHHRHAAYLAIFDLESALSRSPWGSWNRSQKLGRQSAQTPEHWILLKFEVRTLTWLSNSMAWSSFLGNPSIRKRRVEFFTSFVIFPCNIGITIFVGSSFPCCRCSLMAPSSSSKDEFRLISLM